ncbi:MAG TPA: hypothetical protein VFK44_15100 [Bacillales bacterium]|nr:hypothetical protein [Bacillales bacterium]
MKEFIGTCKICNKAVYCENGFFNGILLPGHEYLCYDCDEKQQDNKKKDNG